MSLADLNLNPVYNHSNCPDMIAGLYEPLLREAVRYDRTTYTFTAKGLIAAAAGTVGLIQNGGRIRLICDHTVRSDILQALHDGQIQAETALSQTHNREDLLLIQPDDLNKDHLELATWLVAQGIMEVKVAIRDPSIFHGKCGIVEDAAGNRVSFSGSLNETLSGWARNWESVHVFNDRDTLAHLRSDEGRLPSSLEQQGDGSESHQSTQALPGLHHRKGSGLDSEATATQTPPEAENRP